MRYSIFKAAAVASLVTLGGCSNDEPVLQPAGDETTGTADVEVITTPVEIRLGMPGVNFVTRAAFEDDEDEFDVGVFCLAREWQNINHSPQTISWWDQSVNPLYSSTFCLLNNVESTKSGQTIAWKDGQTRYYPFTQFYSYDFYAYYPYVDFGDTENKVDTTEVGKVYVNYTNKLDGKTDILWGRATSSELYAFSAKYFRQQANKEKIPSIQLDHMLTRLIFQVVPGASVEDEQPADYTAASNVTVASLKVKNVVKNVSLLVADFNRDSANENGTETILGTDEPDRLIPDLDNRQTLSLCGANGEPFEPVNLKDVLETPSKSARLGESIMLYPENTYQIQIELVDSSTGEKFTPDSPLELKYPAEGEVFKAGCQYLITLEVHGSKEVELNVKLTPWQDDNDLTAGDVDFEL